MSIQDFMMIKKINLMKNLFKKSLVLATIISLQSCDTVLDRIHENQEEQNYVSPFKGKYTGTYTGNMSGNLVINVGEKGGVEVTRTTADTQETYYTGLINSSLNTTNKAPSGFMLVGNLNSKNGTWQMDSFNGTWTVVKN